MSTAGPSLSSGRHIQIDTGASEWPVNDTRRHSMVKEAPTILPDHTRDTKILQLFFFFLIYIYIFFFYFSLSPLGLEPVGPIYRKQQCAPLITGKN